MLRPKLSQYHWKASYESLLAWGHRAVFPNPSTPRCFVAKKQASVCPLRLLRTPLSHIGFGLGFWKQVFLVLGVLGKCFFLFFLTGLGSVGVWGFEWFLVVFGSRAQGFRAGFGILLFKGLRRQVFKCLFVSFVLMIVKTLTATPVCLWQFGSAPWGYGRIGVSRIWLCLQYVICLW